MSARLVAITSKLDAIAPRLRDEFRVSALHVFGSTARDEAGPDSDLDVLVDFASPPTFARFMDLKFLLEDELGMRIDLVTRDALRPAMKAQILAEARRVA
jgi:uncharacterized protein